MALNLAIAESTKGYRSARLEAVGRLACNKVDGTGRRILSEKCSLRPLQNFQPLHIQGCSLVHHAVWQGNLIKIHADRRAGRERAVIETHSADRIDWGVAGEIAERETRNEPGKAVGPDIGRGLGWGRGAMSG